MSPRLGAAKVILSVSDAKGFEMTHGGNGQVMLAVAPEHLEPGDWSSMISHIRQIELTAWHRSPEGKTFMDESVVNVQKRRSESAESMTLGLWGGRPWEPEPGPDSQEAPKPHSYKPDPLSDAYLILSHTIMTIPEINRDEVRKILLPNMIECIGIGAQSLIGTWGELSTGKFIAVLDIDGITEPFDDPREQLGGGVYVNMTADQTDTWWVRKTMSTSIKT